ncbi:saccharopine dehydrogenase NADP-binding domain-containing protein [candidate division KSB1 bacterium]|nr:saccharopine dehydrogenase NADP-binding domain-containing protein [candidate division KSB1 bacterium]
MKNVLVLGAGLVTRPLVKYLLEQPEIRLKVASRTVSKAENLIQNHPKGEAQQLNVENNDALKKAIKESDVVISLLPWIHHLKVAKLCLELSRHMVTTSYVKPEMMALDAEAKRKGLSFLNELGVDPGIDHMSAMQIIHSVQNSGGEIVSFRSYCGGLPAPEANTNPLGYKFSWSPLGVILAAKNSGRYLHNGEIVEVPSEKLFEHYWFVNVPEGGIFEAYVNRDAIPYIDLYNIHSTKTMYRGTLRNISHCEAWRNFIKLNLGDQDKEFDFKGYTYKKLLAKLIGGDASQLKASVMKALNCPEYSLTIKKLEWLGLMSDQPIPIERGTAIDVFSHVLQEKLYYEKGERDMIALHHEFFAEWGEENRKEMITSTMVDFGIPGGDTAMARTVGLPAAVATKLLVQGKITLTGVHIPVDPMIYVPVLSELESMDIKCVDRRYEN